MSNITATIVKEKVFNVTIQSTAVSGGAGGGAVSSVNGKTGSVVLDKTDIGLSNVDNTSDLNKPISTATQTALNAKQDTLISGTNIRTVNGNSLLGSGDIPITAAAAWGSITGVLSNQTDLQTALNAKADTATTVTLNTAQTLTARKTIAINGDAGSSSSTGGAILVENTNNIGAGLTVYTNAGATAAGHLFQIRSNNPAFSRHGFFLDYFGTNHAFTITKRDTTGLASSAMNLSSSNVDFSCMQVRGVESNTATLKLTHNRPAVPDASASGLNIVMEGAGTQARNIFLVNQGTGQFVTFRAGSEASNTEVASVQIDGRFKSNATPTDNNDLTTKQYVDTAVATKQDTLVSGTNIKTINGESVLGTGNITVSGGGGLTFQQTLAISFLGF